MRPAHPVSFFVFAAFTAAALAGWAHAQPVTALATDVAAATAPLHHQPLPASGSVETVETDWHSANAAVATFPRGHADILAWEAAQARAANAASSAPTPAAAQPMPHNMHQHAPAAQPGVKP